MPAKTCVSVVLLLLLKQFWSWCYTFGLDICINILMLFLSMTVRYAFRRALVYQATVDEQRRQQQLSAISFNSQTSRYLVPIDGGFYEEIDMQVR